GQQLVVITVAHGHAAHSAVLPHCGVGHFVFGQTWVLHLRGRYVNDLHFYSQASNSWSSLSPTGTLPTARYYHTAVWGISSSGEYGFYIFGGHDGGLLNDLHFYCQASNSWSLLSPTGTLPTARYYHTAVWGISSSGKHGFYIFGGWTGSR
ncbi:unnamed protein product, partial [Durusdinium trenchii]